MDSPLDSVRPLIRTRQIREFTADPLSEEQLDALAQVARWSGSSSNSQPWRFVLVTDVPTVRQMADIALPQTRSLQTATTALAIVMPKDPERTASLAYDEGRVAERILIAANMLGLGAGIGWVREQFRPDMQRVLGVDDDHFVRTIMAIGHPSETARQMRQPAGEARLRVEELVTRR